MKQEINTIYAIITGNGTVQHTDINWSKRILGKIILLNLFLYNIKLHIIKGMPSLMQTNLWLLKKQTLK